MKTIRVFPDYCSSGIWSENGNMDVSQINIDKMTELALYYWHWTWEQWEIDIGIHEKPTKEWLDGFYRQWWEDGAAIAREIQKQNPELLVVYDADEHEELIKRFYN